MKKTILISAVGLLVATACSSDEVLRENTNTAAEPTIKFNTLVQNNTRAENTLSDIQDNGFSVCAYIVNADGNTSEEFIPKNIATYKNGAFWLNQDYYWPGEDKELTFSAFYPSDIMMNSDVTNRLLNVYYSITKDVLGINGTDILIAVSKASHNSNYSEAQKLTFHHLFAQIIVQAFDEASNYKVEIKNTALRYMPASGIYSGQHKVADGQEEFTQEDVKIKSSPSTPDNTSKDSDIDGSIVNAFYAKSQENSEYVEVTSESGQITTLAGTVEDGAVKNGFYSQRIAFDIADETEEESHRAKPIDSWQSQKGVYAAYLELDAKLTQNNSDNPFYEGKIAVPIFNNIYIKPGYRYIFKLKFTNEGAGQYPPDDEEKGGDPILGAPIHFSVEVDGWQPTAESTDYTKDVNLNK